MTDKPDVKMSREEIDRFVEANGVAFVGRVDAEGRLVARPYRYRADGDGLQLLAGDERLEPAPACAVIDAYPSYDQIIGVMLRGTVEPGAPGPRLVIRHAGGFDFSKAAR